MTIPFTVPVVLLLAVIAQAGFAAAQLWAAPYNRLPNRFLALLLLAIGLWALDGFFRVSGIYHQNPRWYFRPIFYSFGFGPLLYFYVRSLINHAFRFRWRRHGWHFAPVLGQAALYWWLALQPYATRLWYWEAVHEPVTYRVEFIGTWVSLVVYLLLSLGLLRQYARWLPENFSETSHLRLRWLRTLLLAVALVSAQWLVEVVLREAFHRYYQYDYSTWLLAGTVLLIGAAGQRQADMRPVTFVPEAAPAPPTLLPLPAPPRAAPVIDPAVRERLRRALEDEHLYLNPTLTLAELAAHTGLAPRLISFTVNHGFGRSFNDWVNAYRVGAVQRRLRTPADVARLSLLGIAFECGFNSKTTFNRIFKEQTTQSPSEWLAAAGQE
ncbi:MAG: helix-turn-helix transcriptional regulator [Hymenobacteraceae bacterium]|nr:helix-turn-helix transcriptional regulator [Hymenobacteraceae bacterium]